MENDWRNGETREKGAMGEENKDNIEGGRKRKKWKKKGRESKIEKWGKVRDKNSEKNVAFMSKTKLQSQIKCE